MKGYRVSIGVVLGVIALVAFWFATLRSRSNVLIVVAGILYLIAFMSSMLGCLMLRGRARAFCVGFAFFGVVSSVELAYDWTGWEIGDLARVELRKIGETILPGLPPEVTETPPILRSPARSPFELPDDGETVTRRPISPVPNRTPPAVPPDPPEFDATTYYHASMNSSRWDMLGNFEKVGRFSTIFLIALVGGWIGVGLTAMREKSVGASRVGQNGLTE